MIEQALLLAYLARNSITDIKYREADSLSHWIPFIYFIWFKLIFNFSWYLFIMPIVVAISLLLLYKFNKIGGGDIPIIVLMAAILQQNFPVFLAWLIAMIMFWSIIWTLLKIQEHKSIKDIFIVEKLGKNIVEGDVVILLKREIYVDKDYLAIIKEKFNNRVYVTKDGIPLVPAILIAYILFIL